MVTSKLFLNNTTQAVRLPKEVAFGSDVSEVEILVQGESRVLVPKGKSWEWWAQNAPHLPSDFSVDRDELLPLDEPEL